MRRSRRRLLWTLAILLLLALAVRLGLEPLARHYTQKGLDRMESFEGTFSDVSFSLVALTYTIDDLVIQERLGDGMVEDDRPPPIFAADHVEARLLWRNLIRAQVIGHARVDGARSTILIVPGEEPKEEAAEETIEEPPPPWELDDAVRSLIPFKVERVQFRESELTIVDTGKPDDPAIRFGALEAAIENFTTRRALDEGKPMLVTLSCGMQDSGSIRAFLSADPLADELTFSLEVMLEDLALRELRPFLQAALDLDVPQGKLDLYVRARCADGRLEGEVKPLLEDVEVRPTDEGLVERIRAALVDTALDVFSDRVPGREAAATIVPIEGHVTGPGVQLWPTVVELLRNAFVEGLAAGFTGLGEEPRVEEKSS